MTIHQLKEPCWILDPNPWGEDAGETHFATRAKASADLAEFKAEQYDQNPDDPGDLEAIQVKSHPGLCWVAECDAPDGLEGTCRETLGDDTEGPPCIHFGTSEELLEWLPGEGWTRIGPDSAFCRNHSPDEAPRSPVTAPAELEAAGQLRLPGVA